MVLWSLSNEILWPHSVESSGYSSSVVPKEQFGCKDVEKMVGVLAVLLYLLNSCVIVFVE
jgi:hypothetical protein